MIPPSVAQHILDREKRQALANTVVGAGISYAAMDCSDPDQIRSGLPAIVAKIATDKLRDAPDKVRRSSERAVNRNSRDK
jgi:uncharacterized protein (DUF2267 family)